MNNLELKYALEKIIEKTLEWKLSKQLLTIALVSIVCGFFFFGIIGNEIQEILEKGGHPVISWSIFGSLISAANLCFLLVVLINRQRLKEAGLHDELTGLYTRTFTQEAIKIVVAKARRTRECFCVFVIDIDSFKQINDKHGHIYGDQVLRYVAETLSNTMHRDEDFAIRSGGDEVTIICSTNNPAQMLERLDLCTPPNNAYGVSISVGISYEKIPHKLKMSSVELEEFYLRYLKYADQVMYFRKEGKKAGRA